MNIEMSQYQQTVFLRTYARWDYKNNRRETYEEAVDRYFNFLWKFMREKFKEEKFERARYYLLEELAIAKEYMLGQNVVGSMRALWTAGAALERENACGFNCAYTTITKIQDFGEILYLLMCGCGVSYSVERQFINSLPELSMEKRNDNLHVVFEDTKEGWAEGYVAILKALFENRPFTYSVDKIRPKGSILKTFGGRASGAEPLIHLINATKTIFDRCRVPFDSRRKLSSDNVSDIVCHIANAIVVGGARRSATLALTNPSDRRMAEYKVGDFGLSNPQRYMVNVSTAYTERPTVNMFLEDWGDLIRSRSGERGIVNREFFVERMTSQGREVKGDEGTNPCGEIILRSKQFCNLAEIICRADDSKVKLSAKTRLATTLAFVQSLMTKYNYIGKEWEENAKTDRILGVSLTGMRDCKLLQKVDKDTAELLSFLKNVAVNTDANLSAWFQIEPAKAVTCVKPSGTVSQLVNSSSGIHVRYAPYYKRRIMISDHDPLATLLERQGMPYVISGNSKIFAFPVASPEGSVHITTAIEQLEYWLQVQDNWCMHNPSCTIYVRDSEWIEVGAWVHKHWDKIGGLSFFPLDDNVYENAPYEEISYEAWLKMAYEMPLIDFSKLVDFEKEDYTEGSSTLACSGGKCEL